MVKLFVFQLMWIAALLGGIGTGGVWILTISSQWENYSSKEKGRKSIQVGLLLLFTVYAAYNVCCTEARMFSW